MEPRRASPSTARPASQAWPARRSQASAQSCEGEPEHRETLVVGGDRRQALQRMAEVVAEVADETAEERRRRLPGDEPRRTGAGRAADAAGAHRRTGRPQRPAPRGRRRGSARQERPARRPTGSSALEQREPGQVPEAPRRRPSGRCRRAPAVARAGPGRGRRRLPDRGSGAAPRDGGQRGGHPAMIGERRARPWGTRSGRYPAAMRASGPGTPPGEPVIVRPAHVGDLPESAARAGLADRRSRRPRGKRAGSARSDPPAPGREPGLTPGRSATRRRPRPASRSGRRSGCPTRSTIRRSCGRGHSRGARGGRTTSGSIARRSGSRR